MKKWLISSIVISIPLLLLFAFVVWPPDIFTNSKHIIASANLSDGNSFTVVQYWNHFDFYSTELHHRFPDGSITVVTLDGDARKSWNVPISVDEQKRLVTVTLSSGRARIVSY